MLTEEDYCDNGETDEGFWYENDLQLAAELGKTLLERNKDLEHQLKHSLEAQHELSREVDLLTKQLDVLRNVNESRMRIYEDVDRNCHDLEKTNERLRQEAKGDKEAVRSLNETVDSLQLRCEELQARLDEYCIEKRRREKREKRTWSVPSLIEASDNQNVFGPYDSVGYSSYTKSCDQHSYVDVQVVVDLKVSIAKLKGQNAGEQRKRERLEEEITSLMHENQTLESKVTRLQREQQKIGTLESELEALNISTGTLCKDCSGKLNASTEVNQSELIEDVDDVQSIPHGEIIRLKNGGSAYGSRESLNMIGLEPDDLMTPVENCGVILATDAHVFEAAFRNASNDDQEDNADNTNTDTSLLGELEVQYRSLVRKYENLIDAKNKRASFIDTATHDEEAVPEDTGKRPSHLVLHKEVQACLHKRQPNLDIHSIDLRSPMDPTDGHFENGPPEYKKLFKEIFDTLKRSVVYELDSVPNAKKE